MEFRNFWSERLRLLFFSLLNFLCLNLDLHFLGGFLHLLDKEVESTQKNDDEFVGDRHANINYLRLMII